MASIPITSPKVLGQVLRQYRKRFGLTQTQAGHKFNLSQKTVSNIESGLPGIQLDTLFRLMAALGLAIILERREDLLKKTEDLW